MKSNPEDFKKEISIPISNLILKGFLTIPASPRGIVLFSHGSGSGRFSERNNFVAEVLNKNGIATLLFDLLTESEDLNFENRFNINLLTDRLVVVTKWILKNPETKKFKVGYFGASTGAASALKASIKLMPTIKVIVSRGGRPDLVIDEIEKVYCPTLLIVGGLDTEVIEYNKIALESITAIKNLEIIPGATHLFEEPGTLEKVSVLALNWFKKYL